MNTDMDWPSQKPFYCVWPIVSSHAIIPDRVFKLWMWLISTTLLHGYKAWRVFFWQTSWFREVKCAVVWTNSIHLDDNNFVFCMMRDSETSLYMSSSMLSKVAELKKKSNFDCMKEGRNGLLRRFQQLMSYPDEIETRNQEEISFSSRIVPRGLLVAEDP